MADQQTIGDVAEEWQPDHSRSVMLRLTERFHEMGPLLNEYPAVKPRMVTLLEQVAAACVASGENARLTMTLLEQGAALLDDDESIRQVVDWQQEIHKHAMDDQTLVERLAELASKEEQSIGRLAKLQLKYDGLDEEYRQRREDLETEHKEHAAGLETKIQALQATHDRMKLELDKKRTHAIAQVDNIRRQRQEQWDRHAKKEEELDIARKKAAKRKIAELEKQRDQLSEEVRSIRVELQETKRERNQVASEVRPYQRAHNAVPSSTVRSSEKLAPNSQEIPVNEALATALGTFEPPPRRANRRWEDHTAHLLWFARMISTPQNDDWPVALKEMSDDNVAEAERWEITWKDRQVSQEPADSELIECMLALHLLSVLQDVLLKIGKKVDGLESRAYGGIERNFNQVSDIYLPVRGSIEKMCSK